MAIYSSTDEKYQSLRTKMQLEVPPPADVESQSVFQPLLVYLAEFHAAGYSWPFLHEFVRRSDITVSFNHLYSWAVKRIGNATGPGSQAAKIVEAAVAEGSFSSAFVVDGIFIAGSAKKSAANGTGTSEKTPAEVRNEVKTKPSGSVSASTESVNPQKTIPSSATTTPEPVAFRSQPPAASVVLAPASVKPVQHLPPLVSVTPSYNETGTAVVTDSDNLAAVKAADKAAKIASVEKWMRDSETNQMGAIVARVISERFQDRRNS